MPEFLVLVVVAQVPGVRDVLVEEQAVERVEDEAA